MLVRGNGVERDPEAAVDWYRKSAEQGLPEAQTALGDIYARGSGVAPDLEAARGWYEKAAAQGHAPAQTKLAALCGPLLVTTVPPLQAQRNG
jgi:TPR repeat protein